MPTTTTPPTGRTILGMSVLPGDAEQVWLEVAAIKDGQRYSYRADPQQLFDLLDYQTTYDDIVTQGYVGTEQEWLDSLIGVLSGNQTAGPHVLTSRDGFFTWRSLTPSDVGLEAVDNTADVDKAVSTPTEQALALKLNTSSVVDNLTTQESTIPLSANQGYVLNNHVSTLTPILDGGGTDTVLTGLEIHDLLIDVLNNRTWLTNPTIDGIENLSLILDSIRSDVSRITLTTARQLSLQSSGRALLPSRPLGDFSHDLAIVHLADGSIVEMTGLTLIEEAGQFFIQLQLDDYQAYQSTAIAVTVSYLTLEIQ